MKTKIIIALLAVLGLIISCDKSDMVTPSNMVSIKEKSFSNYDKLDIRTAFTVYVNFSDTEESIQIEANDNLHQYIIVEESSGVLSIKLKDNVSITGNSTLKAHITTKNITKFTAYEASYIILNDRHVTSDLSINLTEASNLSGEIEVTNLNADISEASLLQLSGTATNFNALVAEASNVSDYMIEIDYLTIDLSDASVAKLTVNKEMDVTASGASTLRYKGTGVITSQNLSGASAILNMN